MLARAFVQALKQRPDLRTTVRLLMAGDGSERSLVSSIIAEAGVTELCWLAGVRRDIPAFLRGLDVFVLPSLSEGISNTILEAMSSGLPVIATRVGGNAELVEHGQTGYLLEAGDVNAMAEALIRFADDEGLRRACGAAGRRRVEAQFSLSAMVSAYAGLYDEVLMLNSPEVIKRAHRI